MSLQDRCCHIQVWTGTLVSAALLCFLVTSVPRCSAQDSLAAPISWRFVVDGSVRTDFAPSAEWNADSSAVAATALLYSLMQDGYWFATVDSVLNTTSGRTTTLDVYASSGEAVRVQAIQLLGFSNVDSNYVRTRLYLRAGANFAESVATRDAAEILRIYNLRGFGRAHVDVATNILSDSTIVVQYNVEESGTIVLQDIELAPEIRSRKQLVARFIGHPVGRPLRGYDGDGIRSDLLRTGLFRMVGKPELHLVSENEAVLSLPLVESSPGSFDLVLGYLPGAGGSRGTIVGSGRLQLVNLFGGGRTIGTRLNRLPGQTSSVSVRAVDPFLFSLPIGLILGFDGEQRDSTYGKQRYDAGLTLRVLADLELSGRVAREATRPGQAGVTFRNGTQRISRADALLAGIGVAYRNTDDQINPRRGVSFESSYDRGSKESSQRRIVESDTVATVRRLRQERLSASIRGYVPIATRQVVALGLDASLLRTDEYDASDLLRIGGANSLRGYNEEQFSGRFVNRWFLEYRYLLDRTSFAYAFFDLGVVEQPDTGESAPGTHAYPGVGIGIQFETGIGIVNASYAINRDDGPANGKVHVGLSFAL